MVKYVYGHNGIVVHEVDVFGQPLDHKETRPLPVL